MKYIIADIHGCYAQYKALLDAVHFREEDELYVLGDAMDRGPEPIRVIQDLMGRPNAFYILGNHDAAMLTLMGKLAVDVSEESLQALTVQLMREYEAWLCDGGASTAEQFRRLSREERADILDYLADAPVFDMVQQDGKLYILVHAGIRNFDTEKELDDYEPADFLFEPADYSRKYFPGDRIFLVTGHTYTASIRPDGQPLVYGEKGHIALDCGCVYGGNLAAYCIDTGEIFYVPGPQPEKSEKRNPGGGKSFTFS